MQIALKVDVDTLRGYLEGVPRLLDLFDRKGIKASFFFSFGPDNSGKAIRRIFRKGFLSKMLRTDAPGTYGLKTMMYGTLLPAPMIVPSKPSVFRDTLSQGHEVGLHAWDHVDWQDRLDLMTAGEMEDQFDRAREMYRKLTGIYPRSCAAPAWKTTDASLAMEDRKGLLYSSDTRGVGPFIPIVRGKPMVTIQIPTTLPTMDEILGRDGVDRHNVSDRYASMMTDELNVHTIHAEMEGMSMLGSMEELIDKVQLRGGTFVTLRETVEKLKTETLPHCPVIQGYLPGRAGEVSIQGTRRDRP